MALKSPVASSTSPSASHPPPPVTEAPVDETWAHETPVAETQEGDSGQNEKPQSSNPDTSSLAPPPSPYPQSVGPSPVDSHGSASTQATDIDDDSTELADTSDAMALASHPLRQSPVTFVDTTLAANTKTDGESLSVIHAPEGFAHPFKSTSSDVKPTATVSVSPATTEHSGNTVLSPKSPEATSATSDKPQINTAVPGVKDRPTPRAQTRQEVEEERRQRSRRNKPLQGNTQRNTETPGLWSTWLADIPETQNQDDEDEETLAGSVDQRATPQVSQEQHAQLDSLRSALSECWTLTNTLANLSSTHRARVFNHRGQTGMQETAWQKCWELCKELYKTRNADPTEHVLTTLTMCREFCTALFDARRKDDELADSVLRVSFELNQHLFNTQDPHIPSAFQERTLDFYLTICHRLMKQRTSLPEETDALLRACWSLAETLFSIRQNNRDGKPSDEELLAVAVQACWDLCDLFREGWSQVRPDRGTPRASNPGYFESSFGRSQSSFSAHSPPSQARAGPASHSFANPKAFPPETPTTIFDDTNEEDDATLGVGIQVPNILVLGNPDNNSNASHHRQPNNSRGWTSAASTYSGYSESTARSNRSASAKATATMQANMACIRILVVRAAMIAGYKGPSRSHSPSLPAGGSSSSSGRSSPSTPSANKAFAAYVKDLPEKTAFGSLPWQVALTQHLKELVLKWPGLVLHVGAGGDLGDGNMLPASHDSSSAKARRSATATDIARAVEWMMRSEQYTWMSDLYSTVFGTTVEDALANDGVSGVVVQA